jgi:flagellar motor switch protein FliG
MTKIAANLRKAAVLLRSLDAHTAATMLAQLSPEEAAEIRAAIRQLGPLDAADQAQVLAELQRGRPSPNEPALVGVELSLSSDVITEPAAAIAPSAHISAKRFEFLDEAPISALVPHLAREHAQTIAVVLSHLAPARSAAVLAALPEKLQAETLERLSALGQSDPESVTVLERELAEWVAKRARGRTTSGRRTDTISQILAATDASTREGILNNLKARNARLAEQIRPRPNVPPRQVYSARIARQEYRDIKRRAGLTRSSKSAEPNLDVRKPAAIPALPETLPPVAVALPHIDFDELVHIDGRALAVVLREMDANVLALALAGSRDELVERITNQMPKRTARAFRRQLRRLGPTRLSDVEAAQRAVASFVSRYLASRRHSASAATE